MRKIPIDSTYVKKLFMFKLLQLIFSFCISLSLGITRYEMKMHTQLLTKIVIAILGIYGCQK